MRDRPSRLESGTHVVESTSASCFRSDTAAHPCDLEHATVTRVPSRPSSPLPTTCWTGCEGFPHRAQLLTANPRTESLRGSYEAPSPLSFRDDVAKLRRKHARQRQTTAECRRIVSLRHPFFLSANHIFATLHHCARAPTSVQHLRPRAQRCDSLPATHKKPENCGPTHGPGVTQKQLKSTCNRKKAEKLAEITRPELELPICRTYLALSRCDFEPPERQDKTKPKPSKPQETASD